MEVASASYTRMRFAEGQAEKRLALRAESMADRLRRGTEGRLRRVKGTESETAPGTRADEKAPEGRMSRMRVSWLPSHESRSEGVTASKEDEAGIGVFAVDALGIVDVCDGKNAAEGMFMCLAAIARAKSST